MSQPPVAQRPPRPLRTVAVAVALALALASGLAPLHPAAPVSAGTAETMEAKFISLLNADRVRVGLRPMIVRTALTDIAGTRAANLAAKGILSHTVAGCLSCMLNARDVQRYGSGEVIGGSNSPWGDQAVTSLYNALKASSSHWVLMMSKYYNYVGAGVAYRSANKNTYVSMVFTESKDQTPPWAEMLTKNVTGTTVSWTWRGADRPLQRHTSGLKDFDVQYRVDGGSWTTIMDGTTATSLSLTGRAKGHWYGLRVRAQDKAWYTSPWTAEMLVWVP